MHTTERRPVAPWFLLSTALAVVPGNTRAADAAPPATPPGAVDPGPRGGAPGAGGPLPGLTQTELDQFTAAAEAFAQINSVSGAIPGEDGEGLGPRFNGNSCAACHAQPALGGTSPAVNPLPAIATLDGARNVVPWFIVPNGPIREARFQRNPDGTPDGGVHALFTIAGRSDAPGCTTAVIQQPDFGPPGNGLTGQGGSANIIFRIPTPLFGAGLLEEIPDAAILANMSASAAEKRAMGIAGHPNRSGNDGTITRFGWKAQNKSILVFSAEAYDVEQGVTNVAFQTERDETPACLLNPLPEDRAESNGDLLDGLDDVSRFRLFTRFLAPPAPAPDTPSIANGRVVFRAIGCALCHTPALTTGNADSAALRGVTANLYSDLLLHDMGAGLADGIYQGAASGSEFRTAPLWGAGQRLYFMHDGRASDLVQAIRSHASPGSEANTVIQGFAALPAASKQDLLSFLRSL